MLVAPHTRYLISFGRPVKAQLSTLMAGMDLGRQRSLEPCMVQVLQSMKDPCPKLCFDRIMYIDCSTWKSKRDMQKKIAEELNLEHKTKAMFDKEDEEDDYNWVDLASRDAIPDAAKVIERTLRDSSYIVFFLNGSNQEVDLSKLGITEYHNPIIIWTFKRRFPSAGLICNSELYDVEMLPRYLSHTNIFLHGLLNYVDELKGSEISALVREEAGTIHSHNPYMQDNDRAMVTYCYLYGLFLHHTFDNGASRLWAAHGANYWICDGIIQGSRTSEISKALCQEAAALMTLLIVIAINLAIGILPHVDNFAHIGGFLTGFLLGFIFLMRPHYGWMQRYVLPANVKHSTRKYLAYQWLLLIVASVLVVMG